MSFFAGDPGSFVNDALLRSRRGQHRLSQTKARIQQTNQRITDSLTRLVETDLRRAGASPFWID